jgi:hypothetical protein
MKTISPAFKGIITGALMVLISIGIFLLKHSFENGLQYITYAVYILGILWTLMDYKPESPEKAKFGSYFGQGFRCYIVVTLIMVLFTYVFLQLNPGMKDEMAANLQKELEKNGNLTPKEIAENVQRGKDYFAVMLVSMTVFGYLLIGSLITLIAAAFFSQRRAS